MNTQITLISYYKMTIVWEWLRKRSIYNLFKYVAPNECFPVGNAGRFDSKMPHFGEYVSTVSNDVRKSPSVFPPRMTVTPDYK